MGGYSNACIVSVDKLIGIKSFQLIEFVGIMTALGWALCPFFVSEVCVI